MEEEMKPYNVKDQIDMILKDVVDKTTKKYKEMIENLQNYKKEEIQEINNEITKEVIQQILKKKIGNYKFICISIAISVTKIKEVKPFLSGDSLAVPMKDVSSFVHFTSKKDYGLFVLLYGMKV